MKDTKWNRRSASAIEDYRDWNVLTYTGPGFIEPGGTGETGI